MRTSNKRPSNTPQANAPKAHNAKSNESSSPLEPDDDPVPLDIDEFRNELARRIYRLIGERRQTWRTCPVRRCRRHHVCAAPNIRCSNLPPPERNGRRVADIMSQVQRALREAMAERGGE